MESNEEPQKRVFKARKTMKVSDRQQLESVYKVKEELLKTDVKLLNGKHENGDSDLNSPLINSDCAEDKEINGIEDLCLDSEEGKINCDEITDAKSPDTGEDQVTDMAPKLENMSPEKIASEQDHVDASTSVPEPESSVLDCINDNDSQVEVTVKDNLDHEDTKNELDEKGIPNWAEVESNVSCNNDSSQELVETNDHACTPDLPVEEEKTSEEVVLKDSIGEQAISSSMDSDQDPKDGDVQSADILETGMQKTVEEPVESILGNSTTMETEEIIPILEKLAPAEDELNCFSKSVLLPVENPNLDIEDKVESSLNSPSKHESSENLPKEAFLVLSDEEELCCEKESEGVMSNQASPSEQGDPVVGGHLLYLAVEPREKSVE
ncbi:UNVERIFIED_CONTAM: hypothetical protein K2H54_074502 [Gekko kuhli]